MRIRTRLLVAFVLVAVPPLLLLAAAVTTVVSRSYDDAARRRLDSAVRTARDRIAHLRSRARSQVSAIAREDLPRVLPSEDGDRTLAETLGARHDLEALALVDRDGRVVSSRHWPAGYGLPEPSRPLPGGELSVETVASGHGAAQRLALLTTAHGRWREQEVVVRGGPFLDEPFVRELSELMGVEVALYESQGRRYVARAASPLQAPDAPRPDREGRGTALLAGRPFAWTASAIAPTVWLVAAVSTDDQDALAAHVLRLTLSFASVALIAAIAVAAVLSAHIARPVRELAEGAERVATGDAKEWGRFLRYHYLQFDFSEVSQPGLYVVGYGDRRSAAFKISDDVFARDVWQPTVEYFLPVQMCHMRVNDLYRVWHGLCHADDALMAPVNHNHFDGYAQGPTTLTKYQPGDHVPGMDRGGWHDAGDYDLRIESQADTIHGLALAWELFHPALDDTTIDQTSRIVDLHRPDGKNDVLQQIEHGVLSIVGAYNAMGRLYRGIQDATLHQYTHLGDAATMTDNQVFHRSDGKALQALAQAAVAGSQVDPTAPSHPRLGSAGSPDDRWVFTEENPQHELGAAGGLAAASRALKEFNPALAQDCLRIAQKLWADTNEPKNRLWRLEPAIELLQCTGDRKYAEAIVSLGDDIVAQVDRFGWLGARSLALVKDDAYATKIKAALRVYREKVNALGKETPYGLPYKPAIWGAGWLIERFGVEQYFLHAAAPDIFPRDYLLHALDFILGCHPGPNSASFVSGVGANSMTTAYGVNRADWSYIPGGIASGTALIRPDFPELLDWPFLWQQGEYCLGHPTSDYVFLVLAADHLLNSPRP